MENSFSALSVEITIFYTQILTRKVDLWSFFTSETSDKIKMVNLNFCGLLEVVNKDDF